MKPRLIILQPTPYCNINCSYCYLGHRDDRRLMAGDVIEAVREKILRRLPSDHAAAVVWHAGEPTAAPIHWYEHAYERFIPVCPPGTSFAMQTNGVAIDERWIALFLRTRTSVSISIDGPRHFHDARRRTRNDRPTWSLATRGLRLLQDAGLAPRVITVLHPAGLADAGEYYRFYKEHGVTEVSFSTDEREGANRDSSFSGHDKRAMVRFLVELMECAYRDSFPLQVREVERVAHVLAGAPWVGNEQVEPWASLVVAADGALSTFSPEFMEVRAAEYGDFVIGNILHDEIEEIAASELFQRLCSDVKRGISACEATCQYYAVCGGGSPVNKYCERADLSATETAFCRLSTQASADALLEFLAAHGMSAAAIPSTKLPVRALAPIHAAAPPR